MKKWLTDILACPVCKDDLELTVYEEDEEIKEGKLICRSCKTMYPIKNYIPRFVGTDKYVDTFSFEWYKHKSTQLYSKTGRNETEIDFKIKTSFTVEDLKDKLVLNADCGVGRHMEIALKYGAKVVGVDLSFSVDVAYENVGKHPNANIIQADIFNLPFKEEIFDIIYSLGVLYHTPNTKKAFLSLLPLLKRGGKIAIWVYSDEGFYMKIYNGASNFWRFFTTKLPPEKLYRFCEIWANLMYPFKKIKPLRVILQIILPPSSYHPDKIWRVLDTYDWLSPKYQWKHTYKEVDQ